jgi:hypothetical protein
MPPGDLGPVPLVPNELCVPTGRSCSFTYFLPAGFAGVVLAVFFGFLVFLSFF